MRARRGNKKLRYARDTSRQLVLKLNICKRREPIRNYAPQQIMVGLRSQRLPDQEHSTSAELYRPEKQVRRIAQKTIVVGNSPAVILRLLGQKLMFPAPLLRCTQGILHPIPDL